MKYLLVLLIIIIISFAHCLKFDKYIRTGKNNLEEYNLEKTFIHREVSINNENAILSDFAAIYLQDNQYYLTNSEKDLTENNIIAKAYNLKTLFSKGWNKLSVHTFKNANPYYQAFFAGYLEARLTSNAIYDFYYNIRENSKEKEDFNTMKVFLSNVGQFMEKKFGSSIQIRDEDINYWSQIFLGYIQLKGLENGYKFQIKQNNLPEKMISLGELLIIQADGEIPELLKFFFYKKKDGSEKMSLRIGAPNYFKKAFNIDTNDPKLFWNRLMWHSKCSAMVKLLKDENGNYKDILTGHTTWSDYYEMNRTYKHYKFYLNGPNSTLLSSSEMTFSSYPGCLSSTDDFYITNNNLVITETTLEVIDIRKYDYVKKEENYVPNFLRVMAASRLAKSAEEWIDIFKKDNSGTYSSQWIIVDHNVFAKIKGTNQQQPKLLYVLEQTPNLMVSHDISQQFYKESYFASFNRAFFEETQIDLNQALIISLYGELYGFHGAKRRKIFNKLQSTVKDLKSFKDVLRHNGYHKDNNEFQDDPSKDNPGSGISARYDLATLKNFSGGLDTKITNFQMANNFEAYAISGPTTENNPNLAPFTWKTNDNYGIIHRGVPETYDFKWILTSPNNLCCNNNDVFTWKP